MKSALVSIIYVISCLTFVSAQSNVKSTMPDNKNSTDIIFDDIMQSLPSDVKSKLDSISSAKKNKTIKTDQTKAISPKDKIPKERFDDLSDELRIKVEKAMQEIDKQNQKRQLEFKESKVKK